MPDHVLFIASGDAPLPLGVKDKGTPTVCGSEDDTPPSLIADQKMPRSVLDLLKDSTASSIEDSANEKVLLESSQPQDLQSTKQTNIILVYPLPPTVSQPLVLIHHSPSMTSYTRSASRRRSPPQTVQPQYRKLIHVSTHQPQKDYSQIVNAPAMRRKRPMSDQKVRRRSVTYPMTTPHVKMPSFSPSR